MTNPAEILRAQRLPRGDAHKGGLLRSSEGARCTSARLVWSGRHAHVERDGAPAAVPATARGAWVQSVAMTEVRRGFGLIEDGGAGRTVGSVESTRRIPNLDEMCALLADLAVTKLVTAGMLTVSDCPEWFEANVDAPLCWPAGSAYELWKSAGSDLDVALRLSGALRCARMAPGSTRRAPYAA